MLKLGCCFPQPQ